MGVERAVTRWYVQRQAILNEIAQLEEELAALTASPAAASEDAAEAPSSPTEAGGQEFPAPVESEELRARLARTQEKLHALGPCPRSMMG